jgi:hypothetical protein
MKFSSLLPLKSNYKEQMLRRMFRPKREQVTERRREMHNEEFHNLYSSLNITVIISRRKSLVGRVARMGREMHAIS